MFGFSVLTSEITELIHNGRMGRCEWNRNSSLTTKQMGIGLKLNDRTLMEWLSITLLVIESSRIDY